MSQSKIAKFLKSLLFLPLGFIILGASSGIVYTGINLLSYAIEGLSRGWTIALLIVLIPVVFIVSASGLTFSAGYAFSKVPPNKIVYFLLILAWVTLSIASIFYYCSEEYALEQKSILLAPHLPCGFYIAFVIVNIIAVIVGANAATKALNNAKRLGDDEGKS